MKDNQAFNIYIRAKKVKVPVSEEVFKIYMRENDAFRRRMQRSGQCKCPTDKSTGCDTDCESCRFFHEKVDADSLDASISEEESLEGDYYEK